MSLALHMRCTELNYPDVDKLISCGKKFYIKAPLRVQKFKEQAPSIPLPPKPVFTRWGSWLNAAEYYGTNYNQIKTIFCELDSDESSGIKTVKDVFTDILSGTLAYINVNFSVISKAIKRLKAVGTQLCEALSIVQHVQSELDRARGHVADKVKNKLQCSTTISWIFYNV